MAILRPAVGQRLLLLRTSSMRAECPSRAERRMGWGMRMGASGMMGSMMGTWGLVGMLMGAPHQRLGNMRMGAWGGPVGEARGRGACGSGRLERRETIPAKARACRSSQ